jgi:site-specific recombinase XerD
LPAAAETVAAFLASDVAAGSRPSTLGRRISAIRYAHKLAGHIAPTDDEWVKAIMRGIRRCLGTAPQKKAPATAERIVSMALAAGTDTKGLRDRAVLLTGLAGAFRRSELVALNVEDLEESELGFKVTIRHSKTDQEGAGQTIAIVRGSVACPVAALKTWLAAETLRSWSL